MSQETLLADFQALLGAENALADTPQSTEVAQRGDWAHLPFAVLAPENTAQVIAAVRKAEESGIALVACGGGTQLHVGNPLRRDKPFALLSLAKMNRILDFQPEDLTVTCEPGATLAQAQTLLKTRRQLLALDVPLAERATLGGIVSTNRAGFWRPAYGSPRDLLIGLRAIQTGGVDIKGGGKVVKNVAGYDLCKLFTGAYGTLGVLTELTFRLRTLPETERVLAWKTPNLATAARAGASLHHARLAPAFVSVTNQIENTPHLLVGMHGVESRVAWQAEAFSRLAQEAGITALPTEITTEAMGTLSDAQAALTPETSLACTLSLTPNVLADFLKDLETSPLHITAHCASGMALLAANVADAALLRRIRNHVPKGAHIVWTRLPAELREREQVAVWGETREDFFLHRALKQALDPKNTFSPGRFLGGL